MQYSYSKYLVAKYEVVVKLKQIENNVPKKVSRAFYQFLLVNQSDLIMARVFFVPIILKYVLFPGEAKDVFEFSRFLPHQCDSCFQGTKNL